PITATGVNRASHRANPALNAAISRLSTYREEHMENTNKDHISVLQKLIEICRNAQEGFRTAAEHVKDSSLKHFFNQQSLERAQFAGELENIVQRLGKHDPDRAPGVGGKMHSVWMDIKSALGGGDHAILNSVEAGEDTAKKEYENAIKAGLPVDIREVVARQSATVINTHDRVRTLRDQFKNAA
ncbi:MAG TPA: PA2169 family four-helix-bundle protein, partial [Terriglobales bacterium]